MKPPVYQWDKLKQEANLARHGVDFSAVYDFDWTSAIEIEDDRRDYGEIRWLALGFIGSRLHVLVYTMRGQAIRVVSLRRANLRERKDYDQAQA